MRTKRALNVITGTSLDDSGCSLVNLNGKGYIQVSPGLYNPAEAEICEGGCPYLYNNTFSLSRSQTKSSIT